MSEARDVPAEEGSLDQRSGHKSRLETQRRLVADGPGEHPHKVTEVYQLSTCFQHLQVEQKGQTRKINIPFLKPEIYVYSV